MNEEQEAKTAKWRERVIRLAQAAKELAWNSGERVPPDETLLRAALAVDLIKRADAGELDDLATILVAAQFMPIEDDGVRAQVVATELPHPGKWMQEAVANNRRLLGLDGEQ